MRTDRLLKQYYQRILKQQTAPEMAALPADLLARPPAGRLYPELLFLGALSVHFFIADPWLFATGICPVFRILF